jgi:hypothetical protein
MKRLVSPVRPETDFLHENPVMRGSLRLKLQTIIRQVLAVASRILHEYLRQRRSLIFWAAFPALMLLLFGLIYRNNPAMRAGFDATPAGILIGAALFFSCLEERFRSSSRSVSAAPCGGS